MLKARNFCNLTAAAPATATDVAPDVVAVAVAKKARNTTGQTMWQPA